jgi:hypothetical protein
MEPDKYLDGEKIDPMPLPDFAGIFKNYERFDVGAMGEFDVAVLIDQFAGAEASHYLYPEWRGGYYYAARPKGDATAPLGLMYASRWSNAEKAADFAAIYAKSLAKRYQRAHQVMEEGAGAGLKLDTLESLTGKHTWLTEEGSVVIEVRGDTVLITESLDQDTIDKLEQAVFQKAIGKVGQ